MARREKKSGGQALSRGRIEEAALRLVEQDGLEAFSTRKLAGELGCEAMSIYHYFPSKAHLMDALLDRIVGTLTLPPATLPWKERMRRLGFEYRGMALRYPKFFQFAVLHRMNTEVGLRFLEGVLRVFKEAGFETEEAARLFRVFGYYIAGAALDEAAGYAKGPSAVVPVPEETVRAEFPEVAAVNPYFKQEHHRATFEIGLEMLLDGIERRRTAATQARRRAASAIIT